MSRRDRFAPERPVPEPPAHEAQLRPRAEMRAVEIAPDMVVLSFSLEAPSHEAPLLAALTVAQREVVLMALAGQSDAAIAEARRCSRHTVSSQLQSAYRRLGVCSRAELAARLASEGAADDLPID